MHRLLTPFVLVVSLFNPNYTRTINKVAESTVHISIQSEKMQGSCTGFVIAVHRVLTANHCVHEGASMFVDGVAIAAVLSQDALSDLALLDSSTEKPPIAFRTKPVALFEILSAVGYAHAASYGWTELTVLSVRVVHTTTPDSDTKTPQIVVQTPYVSGMSGGPVVDSHGEVVSIVQQGDADFGYGVNVAAILAFLGA